MWKIFRPHLERLKILNPNSTPHRKLIPPPLTLMITQMIPYTVILLFLSMIIFGSVADLQHLHDGYIRPPKSFHNLLSLCEIHPDKTKTSLLDKEMELRHNIMMPVTHVCTRALVKNLYEKFEKDGDAPDTRSAISLPESADKGFPPVATALDAFVLLWLIPFAVSILFYMLYKTIIKKKSLQLEPTGNQTLAPKRKRRKGRKSTVNKGFSSSGACTDGHWVGDLFVSKIVIAQGSDGTVVLEGKHNGRTVAVKRLLQAHHKIADKEIQHLLESDKHPSIVRWYGVEHDDNFIYLSLERCTGTLYNLIQACSISYPLPVNGIYKDVQLWKANKYPSNQMLKLMRDIVSGLAHLHEIGIVHRDLKPQNILIAAEMSLCAKLSDMGISKRLLGDNASLGHHLTAFGTSGWQAPEQLLNQRETRGVDLFSLGCVIFYCISGGHHPFGKEGIECDINIAKNQVNLHAIEHIPEAVDLLSSLLDPIPELRLAAGDVMHHPLLWSSEMRLSFLRDMSDWIDPENKNSDILKDLENAAPVAFGQDWDQKMDVALLNDIWRRRYYQFDSTRDLLRVVENKLSHYKELSKEIQEILGPVPEGFDGYFASRYPNLLIEVYKVAKKHCKEEQIFQKYFRSSLL